MDKIFIKIASYRDGELPLTIRSAISQAKFSERLTFGICWQYDERSYLDLDDYLDHPNFKIYQTHYKNSLGCCWARNKSDLLYSGEKYMLQVDAHTRFAHNWDERFIAMLENLDSEKPLLSTYPAPFEYSNGVEVYHEDRGMQGLALNRLRRDLTSSFKTERIDDSSTPSESCFIAAGQIFTHGKFCEQVEYDPGLYFSGEEISLSARAFTHGYDVYCPNEDLLWHFYQHSMPVHSVDHNHNQHEAATQRLRTLFLEDHTKLGKYGLGKKKTLADYEAFAGLNFKAVAERKPSKIHLVKTINLNLSNIEQRDDYDYWIFTLRNVDDEEIYRRDLTPNEIPSHDSPSLDVNLELDDEPVSYGLWPHAPGLGYFRQYFEDFDFRE